MMVYKKQVDINTCDEGCDATWVWYLKSMHTPLLGYEPLEAELSLEPR